MTKRFKEALNVLEPIVTLSHDARADEDETGKQEAGESTPIAIADEKDRVRIWNLYIMILDAAIGLGPQDGKTHFGAICWKTLTNKAYNGTVWDDVIRVGYGGSEGTVDAEVICNLLVYSSLRVILQLS